MKRKLLITGAAVVILGGVAAGSVLLALGSAAEQPATSPALPPATAEITRTTLVETRTVSGTLGYGDPAPISATGTGTLTWIAPVGSTVKRGEPLFKVDGRSVVLLYGPEPLYRTLSAGEDDASLATLRREVASKEVALADALDALSDAEDAAAQIGVEGAATSGIQAADEYRNVFARWLGLALTDAELGQEPATILASRDIDLDALFTRPRGESRIPNLPPNDPDTPWNETVVATWLYLYPSPIYVTCLDGFDTEAPSPSQGRCIMAEIEAAWAGLTAADRSLVRAQRAIALAEAEVAVAEQELKRAQAELEGAAASRASLSADVRQLQENLAELGYTGFTVDGAYTSATAEAVRTWQADLGLPETGTVEPGQVVFRPGAVRIAEHTARVGEVLGGGGAPVLSYTGTARLVIVELRVADQALAVEGRQVTVTVPSRGAVAGEISQVGAVVRDGSIQVTVTIAEQSALGTLDAAPVDVDFVSEERADVLAVPVAALLALAEGGFGVEVVDGNTTRIVAVRTGMFAGGRVEVSGEGIAEGVTVGVPR